MSADPYFLTAVGIIAEAYFNAALVGRGQTPSSEQYADGMNRLNRLVNLKQTKGLKLWTNLNLSVALVAGTRLYTFGPTGTIPMTKPMRVVMAHYTDANNNRRPLTPLSWDEWNRLSNITQQGQITQYFVDKQQLSLNVYFWLTPDATAATGAAHLIIQQQVTNAVGLLDTINFPAEWGQWLTWGLAQQLAIGQPDAIIQRCKMEADSAENILEGWDVEDAETWFAPDSRGAYVCNGFR